MRSYPTVTDWSCTIFSGTEDKQIELVEVLKCLDQGYNVRELMDICFEVDFLKGREPETEPQGYKLLCDVLNEHGFKPRSSGRNPREFIQPRSS